MAGKYLSRLEGEDFIDEKVITPPPECSSFYWNNGYKYKVFMPTKNRDTYFNMEEYNAHDIMRSNLKYKDQWKFAQKCVCLSLSKNEIDKDVRHIIRELKICLSNKRRELQMNNEKNNQFSMPEGSCKFYVLLVYNIKDITNVEDIDRYKHAKLCERMWLSSDEDQELIDLFDTAFEITARRFSNDSKHKVYCYNRTIY